VWTGLYGLATGKLLAAVMDFGQCNYYNVVRQRYFNVSSLHELIDTVNAQNILLLLEILGFIVSL